MWGFSGSLAVFHPSQRAVFPVSAGLSSPPLSLRSLLLWVLCAPVAFHCLSHLNEMDNSCVLS